MVWMMLFWILVIVAVPTVLWFLLSEGRRAADGQKDASGDLLLRRYLLRDIGREEYERGLSRRHDPGRRWYR